MRIDQKQKTRNAWAERVLTWKLKQLVLREIEKEEYHYDKRQPEYVVKKEV